MYGRQEYINPVLGAPYGWGYDSVSWGGRFHRRNPLEELYEQELRMLERYFEREMELLHRYSYGDREYFYRDEHDARSRFEYEKSRLYERLVNHTHWNIQAQQLEIMKYQMYPPITYLLPKETKTVPTETKKFIIISSAGAAEHPTEHKTLAEAEAEATRLAKQFPKQEFTVYETKKSFKVADKPVDVKVYA